MNHKERMQWLKENDPITYYEMTSNPTGTDSSSGEIMFQAIGMVINAVVIAGIFIYFFGVKVW